MLDKDIFSVQEFYSRKCLMGDPKYSDLITVGEGHCSLTKTVVETCSSYEISPFPHILKHLYKPSTELMISVTETTLGPSELSEITLC
jgi:hypothetical protein